LPNPTLPAVIDSQVASLTAVQPQPDGPLTAIDAAPAAAAMLCDVGATVMVQEDGVGAGAGLGAGAGAGEGEGDEGAAPASWRTFRSAPAIVAQPSRDDPLPLGATRACSSAGPVPFTGVISTHSLVLRASQRHPFAVASRIDTTPPAGATSATVGLIS